MKKKSWEIFHQNVIDFETAPTFIYERSLIYKWSPLPFTYWIIVSVAPQPVKCNSMVAAQVKSNLLNVIFNTFFIWHLPLLQPHFLSVSLHSVTKQASNFPKFFPILSLHKCPSLGQQCSSQLFCPFLQSFGSGQMSFMGLGSFSEVPSHFTSTSVIAFITWQYNDPLISVSFPSTSTSLRWGIVRHSLFNLLGQVH